MSYGKGVIYMGSDVGQVEKYLKEAFKYTHPQYLKYIKKEILINIWKEYKSLVKKGYSILKSETILPQVKFTPLSYVTIKLLTKNTNLPSFFIYRWGEILYKLAKTGKILLANLDPSKKDKSDFIEEIKKQLKLMKITLPLAIGAGVLASIVLLKK